MLRRKNSDRQFREIYARLGDAVIDPAIWPEIMEQISASVGAAGAGLLQSDIRSSDVPRTAGVDEMFGNYFTEGWNTRDIRAERGVPLLLGGATVVIDQDILTPEEINRDGLYQENLRPYGFQWFAVVGFWSGPYHWGLSIQRTIREGPFEAGDKHALGQLSPQLTETATLSKAVGRSVLLGMTNALDLIKQPAIALDGFGNVIDANAAAEQIFDDEIRIKARRLFVSDQSARFAIDSLIDHLRATPDEASLPVMPIVVRRKYKHPIIISTLPVSGAARSPFCGARVLLTFQDMSRNDRPKPALLAQIFGLSPAETRLALLIAGGMSVDQAAESLEIARETARNQLKAIFAKTSTHRQGELVALLSRLSKA